MVRAYGNLINRIAEHTTGTPVVGMGCTICMYSDRHAATVVNVLTSRRIVIQQDKAIRTDKNGMSESQAWDYEPNPTAPRRVFIKHKNGTWKEMIGSTGLLLGVRDEYYDFSF